MDALPRGHRELLWLSDCQSTITSELGRDVEPLTKTRFSIDITDFTDAEKAHLSSIILSYELGAVIENNCVIVSTPNLYGYTRPKF